MLDFYQLLKAAEKGEKLRFYPSEKVMTHFNEMQACLLRSFGDDEVYDKKAESCYFAMRYNEILNIYAHYIQNINKLIDHMLEKDERFKDYLASNFHAVKKMPPVSTAYTEENRLGVIGKHLLSSMNAGNASEWSYILENDSVLEIIGKKKELPSNIDVKPGSPEILCKILDALSTNLNLKNEKALNALKEYFILKKQLDEDFDLRKLFENLGFKHLFGLKIDQLVELQQTLVSGINGWEKIAAKHYVQKNDFHLKEFLSYFCNVCVTNQSKPMTRIEACGNFEKLCQMLYLIETDKDNTEREDLLKILMILRLINQDLSHSYTASTLNTLHSCVAKENFATIVYNKEVATKNYKIVFDEKNQISIIGMGYYAISHSNFNKNGKPSSILRDEFTLRVNKEHILEKSYWSESYESSIVLVEPPNEKVEEQMNIFRIICFINQINCKVQTFYPKNMGAKK